MKKFLVWLDDRNQWHVMREGELGKFTRDVGLFEAMMKLQDLEIAELEQTLSQVVPSTQPESAFQIGD